MLETLKIVLLSRREHNFYKIELFEFDGLHRAAVFAVDLVGQDVEIEVAVAVVIGKGRNHAPIGQIQAPILGAIDEFERTAG